MAKFTYTGDGEIVIPSLGLTLTKGDQFEGPDDLINLLYIEPASKASKASTSVQSAPVADQAASEPSAPAETDSVPVSTDPTSN